MAIELFRIDDRLIHGQVVVGWGQPLGVRFIVLVDDEVAGSDWEQELYRMGVPPEMELYFEHGAGIGERFAQYQRDPRPGILITGDIATMARVVDAAPGGIASVNLGGIHHRPGRRQRLRYVFVDAEEERALRDLAGRGVTVTAQDVPSARPVPLEMVLDGKGEG